jgi:hypothetical protein
MMYGVLFIVSFYFLLCVVIVCVNVSYVLLV